MKRQAISALIVVALVTAAMAQQDAAKLLDLTDVVQVLSLKAFKGLKTAEKNILTGNAPGDVNVVDADGNLVLYMDLHPASEFKLWKRDIAAAVSGVGDEAYEYPKSIPAPLVPNMLVFRKGSRAVMLGSGFDAKSQLRVSQAQLKQLAQKIAAKL